ncbi:MAG: TonB-dependent receptor [Phycisphaerae bacterium]|nr:TonB-dependent receptor [Phycisphaerae bacterium]
MAAGKILSLVILLLWPSGLSWGAWEGSVPADSNAAETDANLYDMSIEELMDVRVDTVFGASKRVETLAEAPASVTIITAEEIRRYGYRTLAEILRGAPGFYINYDRNYNFVGTRGFRRPGDYDTRILLLIDGHRANNNVGDAPTFGTELAVDVDLIEKVEVIRGPGSALYGSNAVLAVVNVITKRGEGVKGLELSGQTGSFDTQKARITYGERLDQGIDVLLSASTYNSDGPELYYREFDSPETRNGLVDNDDDQFDNLVARISWGDLSFLLAHTSREKGIPTAAWDTVFGDPRTRTWDCSTIAGLTWSHALSEQHSISARAAYGHSDYDGRYVYDWAEEGDEPYIVVNKDYWKGRWWEGELQWIGNPVEGHVVTAGTEVRYNARQDQACWDIEETYLDDSRHSDNWGVYLQDEFTLLASLKLIGGIRYDKYSTFGGATNPRLALIYNPFEHTTLKLLYGKAFRAPNAYELYYHDGGYTQKATLDLDPEKIDTYEAVLERQFHRNVRASVSGFYYVMEDLIDQYLDPADELLVFRNLGEVEAAGAELALIGKWDCGLQSRVSYSYVQAKDQDTDETLVDSPKHLVKLHLLMPVVPERLFAGLEVLYDSKAKTLTGGYADDFALTNLTLTYVGLSKRLEIAASVYNLFDVEYAFPGFGEHTQDTIVQDGRTFRVGLTYRF